MNASSIRKKSAAFAVLVGLALGGCSAAGADGSNSSGTSSSGSTVAATAPASTASDQTDGLALLDSLKGTSGTSIPDGDVYATSQTGDSATVESVMAENQAPHADSNDATDDRSSLTASVSLSGSSASIDGEGVEVSDGVVTITAEGTYLLSGSFDGQIRVSAPDSAKVTIILDGVDISSSTDAAIRVTEADEVVLVLAEGTENTVSDASTYASDAESPTAAIASSSDLTIGGSGTLTVKGNANDGISSSDGLVITGGTINVTAVDDAVRGQDYVVVAAGTLNLTASGGDAIKADNEEDSGRGYVLVTGGTINATASSDGIDAVSDVVIAGGTINATQTEEGIEAAYILLAGGSGAITSSDDALNATGGTSPWLSVLGGEWTLYAEGDGIDANGYAYQRGGTVTVWGPAMGGNGSIDVDYGLDVSGGTLFTAGAQGMAQNPSTSSAQASIAFTVNASKGDTIEIRGSDGTVIASYTLEVSAGAFIYSSASILSGESYTVTVNGSEAATAVGGSYNEGGFGGGMPGGGMPGGGAPGAPMP